MQLQCMLPRHRVHRQDRGAADGGCSSAWGMVRKPTSQQTLTGRKRPEAEVVGSPKQEAPARGQGFGNRSVNRVDSTATAATFPSMRRVQLFLKVYRLTPILIDVAE